MLSFSESEHEAQIFETLTQNKANMLKLFAEYGMRLDDIEQGSIHFKFSIPVGDDKIPVFQEASMKTIIAEICQGALNTLPGGKTEDIHFDFEFTPLKNVHCEFSIINECSNLETTYKYSVHTRQKRDTCNMFVNYIHNGKFFGTHMSPCANFNEV